MARVRGRQWRAVAGSRRGPARRGTRFRGDRRGSGGVCQIV